MGSKQDKNMVTGKHGRSLIAYAFLAQATRCEGDLLGGLAPIFKPIAKIFAGKRFDPKEFAAQRGFVWVFFRIIGTLRSFGIGYFIVLNSSVKGNVDEACAHLV